MSLMRVRITIEVTGYDGVGGAKTDADFLCTWDEVAAYLAKHLDKSAESVLGMLSAHEGAEVNGTKSERISLEI